MGTEVLSTLLGGVIGGIVGYFVERQIIKKQKHEQALQEIYQHYISMHSNYEILLSYRSSDDTLIKEIKKQIRKDAWRIIELLRINGSIECSQIILHTLTSNTYSSPKARLDKIKEVANELARAINPRHEKELQIINDANKEALKKNGADCLKDVPMNMYL